MTKRKKMKKRKKIMHKYSQGKTVSKMILLLGVSWLISKGKSQRRMCQLNKEIRVCFPKYLVLCGCPRKPIPNLWEIKWSQPIRRCQLWRSAKCRGWNKAKCFAYIQIWRKASIRHLWWRIMIHSKRGIKIEKNGWEMSRLKNRQLTLVVGNQVSTPRKMKA
jgi:hypothetical protein